MAKENDGIKAMNALRKRVRAQGKAGLLAAGHELERVTVLILSQPGHGRLYKNRGPGRGDHRASAPMEPPAVDSNRLRLSIATVDQSTATRLSVVTGTDVEYAPELEFGRRKMAPRPFFRPAFGMARRRMGELVRKYLRAI